MMKTVISVRLTQAKSKMKRKPSKVMVNKRGFRNSMETKLKSDMYKP